MSNNYEKYKNKEFPDFIIHAISDVVSQYTLEYAIKDKNIILRFSKFAEDVVSNLQESMINAHNEKFNDLDFIENFLTGRKKLIQNNLDLYSQLEHLESFNIEDYVIDSIVKSVNSIEEDSKDFSDIENRDFYCLFGENLVLDIRNYMRLNKINHQKQ
jgi:hypothetical protein